MRGGGPSNAWRISAALRSFSTAFSTLCATTLPLAVVFQSRTWLSNFTSSTCGSEARTASTWAEPVILVASSRDRSGESREEGEEEEEGWMSVKRERRRRGWERESARRMAER